MSESTSGDRTGANPPSESTRELWNDHADWWTEEFTDGVDPEYTEQIVPLVVDAIGGPGRVLDIGTGEGQVARALRESGSDVIGIDPTLSLLATARERDGGTSVAAGVAGTRMPNIDVNTTQIDAQTALPSRLAVANHHGRPGQAWHTVGTTKQTGKAVHLALHVFSAAFDNQIVSALAGDHLCRAFICIRTGTQHTHRVVVGQQHQVDIRRRKTDLGQIADQSLRSAAQPQPLAGPGANLVTVAGIDQDQAGIRLDQERASIRRDEVLLVRLDHPLPKQPRDQAKKAAAVHLVQAVAENMTANRTHI